jgi:arylsulfatase A-like enzyme
VASRLHELGYWSFGISENALISADAGFAHGFDFYWSTGVRSLYGAPTDYILRQLAVPQIARRLLKLDYVNWYAESFLHKRYEPFFGFLQYLPVHDPYVDRRRDRWATPTHHAEVREHYEQGRFINNTSRPTQEVARVHTRYLGSVNYADWLIARLIDTLEERDLLENTILVITADHGENIAEHGDRYAAKHGGYFTSSLEIPLVVSSPRLGLQGEVLTTLTGADRIADLILDAASDDSHLLTGRLGKIEAMVKKEDHFAYARPCFVLFDDSVKVVMAYENPDTPARLFRWREDPWDERDLSEDMEEETSHGIARIDEIVRINDLITALEEPTPVDEQRLRHLRALGYID